MVGRIKFFSLSAICFCAFFNLITCSGDNPLGPNTPLPEALGWVEQVSPIVDKDLIAVDFVNARQGWIVGGGGVILHTSDGGQNWSIQESGVSEHLMDVKFLDSRNGWAVGFEGRILRTVNGGHIWTIQESGTTSRFEEITFLDNKTGWITGRIPFALLRTSDGGQSWQADSITGLRLLSSLTFTDEKSGIAIADWDYIVSTNDGGKSWSLLSETGGHYVWNMTFLNSDFGLAVCSKYGQNEDEGYFDWHDIVFKTIDGGKSWSKVYTLRGSALFGGSAYLIDSDQLFIVGGPLILVSHDGGESWNTQYYQYFSVELYAADFVNSNTGWAVGKKGTILHTTNGGITPTP